MECEGRSRDRREGETEGKKARWEVWGKEGRRNKQTQKTRKGKKPESN